MNLFNLLGGIFANAIQTAYGTDSKMGWLKGIATLLDNIFVPLIVVLTLLGTVLVIKISVDLAKAESPDKATEAKKRLINIAVAFVSGIVFTVALTVLAAYAPVIFDAVGSGTNSGATPGTFFQYILR